MKMVLLHGHDSQLILDYRIFDLLYLKDVLYLKVLNCLQNGRGAL